MTLNAHYDWIVVGAGIIGSLAAWRLAQKGLSVALVDAGSPGQQATAAAAGILSPLAEATASGSFVKLMHLSLQRYPTMIAELTKESGMDMQYHISGALQVAREEDREQLRHRYTWQEPLGAQWVDQTELKKLEPHLIGYSAAIYDPTESQVHPPLLVQAAVRAALARGVTPYFGSPVRSLVTHNDTVQGVALPSQDLLARHGVVIAAGAWSGLVTDLLQHRLPVVPIRGQVISVKQDQQVFRHIIFHGHTYLVPKRDGRLVVGATEDVAGFDSRVTTKGLSRLSEILQSFGLSESNVYVERVWAGLRPKSADGLPVLGPWPGRKGLYLATGHYRNGVLLSVLTADIISGWATGQPDPMDLTPFQPGRFWNTNSTKERRQ